MAEFVLFVVVGTTIWVMCDSHSNKIPSGSGEYSLNNGAVGWGLGCLLLWIVGFPYYLLKRHQVLRDRLSFGATMSSPSDVSATAVVVGPNNQSQYKKCPYCAETIRTEAVLCRFCKMKLPLHDEQECVGILEK
jgi:hypothetical protein